MCDLWPRPVCAQNAASQEILHVYANVTGMQSSVLAQVHCVTVTRKQLFVGDPKVGFGDPEEDTRRCQRAQSLQNKRVSTYT